MILEIAYRSVPHGQFQTAHAIKREFPNPQGWIFLHYDLDEQFIRVQIGEDTLIPEQQAWLNNDKRIAGWGVREETSVPFPGND